MGIKCIPNVEKNGRISPPLNIVGNAIFRLLLNCDGFPE